MRVQNVYIHSMEHKRPALRPFNAFRAIDMPVKDKISHADKVTQRGVRQVHILYTSIYKYIYIPYSYLLIGHLGCKCHSCAAKPISSGKSEGGKFNSQLSNFIGIVRIFAFQSMGQFIWFCLILILGLHPKPVELAQYLVQYHMEIQ